MHHSPSIKMLIPSHQSFHINLINVDDSSLCHAQIENIPETTSFEGFSSGPLD